MPAPKHKPKPAAKPATNASRVKSAVSNARMLAVNRAAKITARTTTQKPATTRPAVKVALKAEVKVAQKAVVNAHQEVKVAVNALLAKTTQRRLKACHSTRTQRVKTAKHRKPTKTVASVANAVHATATAVTVANAAASVPNVHLAKTVRLNRPHTTQPTRTKARAKHPFTVNKMSVANPKFATSKSLANNAHPAKRVPRVKSAHLVRTVRLAVNQLRHPLRLQQLSQNLRQQPPSACPKFKRLLCLCLSCTPLPKAAVWNG